MKKEDLIAKLQAIPDNLEILNYIEETEEYGKTDKVTLMKVEEQAEEMPYAKGDVPHLTENIILISGWTA